MKLASAPFHADLAEGPAGARAYWVRSDDGLRLRVAHYPGPPDARGTVLLFPGRTEYVEKYGRTAIDLARAGYHTLTIDWRGQGMADRMLEDPRAGHVHVFSDYQHDVAAMLDVAQRLGLPRRHFLIGHSMGGCIGLRSVMDGLEVAACAFTGPMWGIRISTSVRPAAWALSWGSARVGLGHLYAPGTGTQSYVSSAAFDDNTLTTDPDQWDYMRRHVLAIPQLQLGGPSLNWLHEALAECRDLNRRPSPDLPAVIAVGENERIVDFDRIVTRAARWPGADLMVVEGGEHELLMEAEALRQPVVERIIALFDSANGSSASLSA